MKDYQPLLKFVKERSAIAESCNEDTLLFEEKIIDSINILDLIGYVEKHLGRKLTEEELLMSNFKTVRIITDTFL